MEMYTSSEVDVCEEKQTLSFDQIMKKLFELFHDD